MITADKVKNQIQTLIETANEKTGKEDADLTSAVGSLVEGFGGSVEKLDLIQHIARIDGIFRNANFPKDTVIELNLVKLRLNGSYLLASNAFQEAINLIKVKLVINESIPFVASYMFQTCSYITEIDIGSKRTLTGNNRNMFSHCVILEYIRTELNLESVDNTTDMFKNCTILKEVRFTSGSIKMNLSFSESPSLSADSIQSIIDGLADLTGQTAQTLTLHADVKAKLTDAQIAQITSKNWTLS